MEEFRKVGTWRLREEFSQYYPKVRTLDFNRDPLLGLSIVVGALTQPPNKENVLVVLKEGYKVTLDLLKRAWEGKAKTDEKILMERFLDWGSLYFGDRPEFMIMEKIIEAGKPLLYVDNVWELEERKRAELGKLLAHLEKQYELGIKPAQSIDVIRWGKLF